MLRDINVSIPEGKTLAIVGVSGSGKTTFIQQIARQFSSAELTLVSQDDYYKKKELQQKDENGEVNFDLPSGVHEDELLRDLFY